MSNVLNRAQRNHRHAARLAWLEAHPALEVRLAGAHEDVSVEQSLALGEARESMVRAGLYSHTSDIKATRWGIRLLVSELRGHAVHGTDYRYIKHRRYDP